MATRRRWWRQDRAQEGRYAPDQWKVWLVAPFWVVVASAVAGSIYLVLRAVAVPRSGPNGGPAFIDPFDVIKITITVAGFVGAVLVGVYGYRKQRLVEGDAHRADAEQLAQRYTTAAGQLGHEKAAVRLAGVYAMARLADDWNEEQRQVCIDVLCAYLRIPYETDSASERYLEGEREVRRTIIRLIRDHLQDPGAPTTWCRGNLDFANSTFDCGNFDGAKFTSGEISFNGAQFTGGGISFHGAQFTGGEVSFYGAQFTGVAVSFHGADFTGGTVSFEEAKLTDAEIYFPSAKFATGVAVYFDDMEFASGRVSFVVAEFTGGEISFDGAEFTGGEISFVGAKFAGSEVHFNEAKFTGGEIFFSTAEYTGGKVSFDGAEYTPGCHIAWGPFEPPKQSA